MVSRQNTRRPRATRPASRARPARPAGRWTWVAALAATGVLSSVLIVHLVRDDATDGGTGGVTAITGVTDYRESAPATLTRNHRPGRLTYPVHPPVGGDHNGTWQNCAGAVYPAPVPDEHAVHSLEHGAVWLTYRPDLPAEQIGRLAARVQGHDYTMLSPYPGQETPISVQAWGYQLHVTSAEDTRIDAFITATRVSAAPEPGATCSGGNTSTGSVPNDGGPAMPQSTRG